MPPEKHDKEEFFIYFLLHDYCIQMLLLLLHCPASSHTMNQSIKKCHAAQKMWCIEVMSAEMFNMYSEKS